MCVGSWCRHYVQVLLFSGSDTGGFGSECGDQLPHKSQLSNRSNLQDGAAGRIKPSQERELEVHPGSPVYATTPRYAFKMAKAMWDMYLLGEWLRMGTCIHGIELVYMAILLLKIESKKGCTACAIALGYCS